DAPMLQLADDLVPIVPRLETYDIDEPAHARGPAGLHQEIELLGVLEACPVPRCDAFTVGEQLVEPLDLHRAERCAQLVEAVVVAEATVREPSVEDVSPLVAKAAEQRVPLRLTGDDHSAFTRGHLLVRVEGENPGIPKRPHRTMLVGGTD